MELPRELWEGQNMKVVTPKCVNIDVWEKMTWITVSSPPMGE